ncbi:NAD(+) diphosphatase [Demequina muriae]|uniref:NAD(+) diphosphatase n=1 Tax=Demequina muriae TaxID=3051664 RepID=A0ABT8GHT2_9MICO|nr:NAD(+) diphosphatase [Demequina sp. EGI L300058]MDN4480983.1 NAD(+) diphosphatase [Demequina sp. EGI L300058]
MNRHLLLDQPLIIDRGSERRELVDTTHAHAVVVRDGAVLAIDGDVVELPPSERPAHGLEIYLGRDGEHELVAVVPDGPLDIGGPGARMTPLRELLGMFAARGADGARDRELATTAVAISAWHASHPRCALCGSATEPRMGGWVRRCPTDQRDHYPRTDPAVIVAITDGEDRMLMAHASHWSANRFSHLAGYVEPGESLEQAAHREVAEESGLVLHDLTYAGSQPWPFPASVMVGFRARVDDPAFVLDDDEISEAMWVSRAELDARVADGTLVLAPPGSIARRLLEEWYGSTLP